MTLWEGERSKGVGELGIGTFGGENLAGGWGLRDQLYILGRTMWMQQEATAQLLGNMKLLVSIALLVTFGSPCFFSCLKLILTVK